MSTDNDTGGTPVAYVHETREESALHQRAAQLYTAKLTIPANDDDDQIAADPGAAHRNALAAVADDVFALGVDTGRTVAVTEFVNRYNATGGTPDLTPDQFWSLVHTLSDLAQKSLRRSFEGSDTPVRRDVLEHTLGTVLDLTSAISSAFELPGLPNGSEFRELYRVEDVTTADYDELRLHALSTHCNLAALGLTDREVLQYHHDEHYGTGGLSHHPYDDRTWSEPKMRGILDENHDLDARAANHLVLTELVARLQPAPAVAGSRG